ncbi:MAG: bifunctional homocysteine S-methyltransferase/methylenetetrahydrofolate reductase [Armatimonadota bacterium]|nr:bifunctional homocysteine S-methyltransferase/methylenetetrahydrofolate reductase [bacterium]
MTRGEAFLSELQTGAMVGDGAIGTALFARGVVPERGVERMNMLSPSVVLQLHRDYVASGSHIIETNTFGANLPNLMKYGVESEEEARAIILTGSRLARTAASDQAYIAGSIGPLPTVDGEPIALVRQTALFTSQITALIEGGVDLLIFESFTILEELAQAVAVARSLTDIPIVAQASFGPESCTADGASAEEVAFSCISTGASVVGANCGYGVESLVNAVKSMVSCGAPVSAYLNAGLPERVEERMLYTASPNYLVEAALDLVDCGVRIIGGCCGTEPETIRLIAKSIAARKAPVGGSVSQTGPAKLHVKPMPRVSKSVPVGPILVELDPPRTLDVSPLIAAARAVKNAGASAVTVADNPLASVRVDNITVAGILQRETGLPVIPHLTGRDRNRLALQSAIMGAHVLGIHSMLCVTGDPVGMCQEPNTSGVFDLTSVGLVRLISDFNAGHRMSGDCQTRFTVGVAVNPNVRTLSGQVDKLKRKVEAGAHYALTQPVFDVEKLEALMDALDQAGMSIPVYAGIMPLLSARNAEFLHNEVPGIVIPEDVRKRMAEYTSVADQRAVGAEIATEMLDRLAGRVHGFYFICPGNNVDTIVRLITTITPRQTRSEVARP